MSDQISARMEELELNKETLQELTESEAEQLQGGGALIRAADDPDLIGKVGTAAPTAARGYTWPTHAPTA